MHRKLRYSYGDLRTGWTIITQVKITVIVRAVTKTKINKLTSIYKMLSKHIIQAILTTAFKLFKSKMDQINLLIASGDLRKFIKIL